MSVVFSFNNRLVQSKEAGFASPGNGSTVFFCFFFVSL